MDNATWDAICDKLRQNLYITGSDILYQGGPVEKMVFIVRGRLESISADGNKSPLQEGDVCGEELLSWYLEQSSVNRGLQMLCFLDFSCLLIFPFIMSSKMLPSYRIRWWEDQVAWHAFGRHTYCQMFNKCWSFCTASTWSGRSDFTIFKILAQSTCARYNQVRKYPSKLHLYFMNHKTI